MNAAFGIDVHEEGNPRNALEAYGLGAVQAGLRNHQPFVAPPPERLPREAVFAVEFQVVLATVRSIDGNGQAIGILHRKTSNLLKKMNEEQAKYKREKRAENTRVDTADMRSKYIPKFLGSQEYDPDYKDFIESFDPTTGKMIPGSVASKLKNGTGVNDVAPFLRSEGLRAAGNNAIGLTPFVIYKMLYLACLASSKR